MRNAFALLISLVLAFGAAAVGGYATASSVGDWYQGLTKPSWNPPDWVFGPVWTLLYAMMAFAAWLVWRKAGFSGAAIALGLYGAQLLLNIGWSILFFGLQMPGAAFGEILLLWAAIAATALAFGAVSPAAGWLMAPYLAWVSFASALNFTIWRLN